MSLLSSSPSSYFNESLPIDKTKFISIYNNIIICCQLIIIPFGMSSNYSNNNDYYDDYVLIYKQIEESLSKQVYQLLGISIESIGNTIYH